MDSYLLKISSRDLSERESHQVTVMLHCINDFERIADHAVNIKESAEEKYVKGMNFSDKASRELEVFSSAIKEIMNITLEMFINDDEKQAAYVEPLEEVVDELSVEMKFRHVARLRKGKCTVELGFVLQDLTTSFERVADHCSNIAIYVMQENADDIDTHEFIGNIKNSGLIDFEGEKMYYRHKFELPSTKLHK